jgi:uroporphyrinogen decarboxylase
MAAMTPRERLRRALNHQEPDRIPLDLGSYVSTIEVDPFNDLKKYLGKNWETKCFLRDHVQPPEELLKDWGIDTRYVRMKAPEKWKVKMEADHSYADEWGTRWKKPESSLYWDPVGFPLKDASVADLEKYPWPDPNDPGRTAGLREEAQRLRTGTNYAIVADAPCWGLFEAGWVALRGPEQYFMDMVLNKPFIKALMERLADIQIQFYKNYLAAVGDLIDVIMAGDDLGGESGPLISLATFRELVKPYQKKVWGFIKEHTDAKLFLHCCGGIRKLLPDLIEMGVDIINPVQVAAKGMDSRELKKEFGGQLSFWGGVDTQRVMPFGTPDDVENEVKKRVADLAPGGGFVLTAVHNIQSGVKPENMIRLYESARKYGTYPIRV